MFLKIVTKNNEGVQEILYECKTFRKFCNKDGMVFTLDDITSINIDGETTRAIYIMNNEGKTVDTMYWKHNKYSVNPK